MSPGELETRLAQFLAAETGAPHVVIHGLRKLPGGASRETWAFDAVFDGGALPTGSAPTGCDASPTATRPTGSGAQIATPARRRLVLRRDPGPTSVDSDRAQEFRVMQAAHRSGVPVPEVYWLGSDTRALGSPFFIMERVEGETLARRLLRDAEYAEARTCLAAQLGAALARIHHIDVESNGLDFLPAPENGRSPAASELARYEQLYRSLAPEVHPVIELGFRWLARRIPAAPRITMVHGDYRVGNVMFGPEGLRAVLDWELVHRGDPMEDLGWLCVKAWRFGSALPVGGVGERDALFRAYEAAGGGSVDPAAVHYWEVFGNLKWAVICIGQARTFLDGVPSVELASLGRRTAEVEHELLALIDDSRTVHP